MTRGRRKNVKVVRVVSVAGVLNSIAKRYTRSRRQLAIALGASEATLMNWIERDRIPAWWVKHLKAVYPELNEEWIVGDSDEMLTVDGDLNTYTGDGLLLMTAKLIEGFNVTCGDVEVDLSNENLELTQVRLRGVKYLFRCSGESMEPRLFAGDLIGVGNAMSRFETFKSGEIYLVFTQSGKAMVKMVEDPGPDVPYLKLLTFNPNYHLDDDGKLPKSEFRAAFRVKAIVSICD